MMAENESNLKTPLPLELDGQIEAGSQTVKRRPIWLWLGGGLLVGLGGSLLAGSLFVQYQLAPLVEARMAAFLHRPVKLGPVQSFSLNGVRFGSTKILATPTDPAHLSLKALELNFDLLQFLWQHKLQLYFNAIEPDIYLEQGINRSWLLTKLGPFNNPYLKLGSIHWQKADLTLVARSTKGQKLPEFHAISPSGGLSAQPNQQIAFNLALNPRQGGNLQIAGTTQTTTGEINILLRGNEVAAAEVGKLFPLPLQLQGGAIEANLELQLRKNQLPRARGIATLQQLQATSPQLPQAVSDVSGQLRFQGTQVRLEGVNTRFGAISATTSGTVDWQTGYALNTQIQPFSPQQVVQSLKLKPLSIPVNGEVKADLQVGGSLTVPNFTLNLEATKPTRLDKFDFRHLSAKLQGTGQEFVLKELQALPAAGGVITLTNAKLNFKNSPGPFSIENAELSLRDLPLAALGNGKNNKLLSAIGLVSGNTKFSGEIASKIENSQLDFANIKLAIAGGIINSESLKLAKGTWQTQGKIQGIALNNILSHFRQLPFTDGKVSSETVLNRESPKSKWRETIDGSFKLAGTLNNSGFNLNNSQLNLALAGGTIKANSISLVGNNWQAIGEIRGIKLKNILPNLSLPIGETLAGSFNLTGTTDNSGFRIDNSQLAFAFAEGTLAVRNLQLEGGQWQANLLAHNLSIANLSPNLPSRFSGKLNGQIELAGNLNNKAQLQGSGTVFLGLSSGTIAAEDIKLNQGKFTATIIPQNLLLAEFSPNLRGRLRGRFGIEGNLANLQPTAIQATGKVNLSQGLGWLNQSLTADFHWNGKRLDLAKATSAGFTTSGWTDLTINNKKIEIDNFAFKIAASDINLQNFPLTLPTKLSKLNYRGTVDFGGTVTGTPTTPQISGELALKDFQWANIALEPVLKGTVTSTPNEPINLKLSGKSDRLAFSLDRKFQPLSFDIQWQNMGITGQREGEQMLMAANQIKLELLPDLIQASGISISPVLLNQKIGGELSGNLTWNFANSLLSGHEIAIANPQFGIIRGERLAGNFRYQQGNFAFDGGQFQYGKSLYSLSGSLKQTANGPEMQGEIALNQGKIQDILEAFQIFEVQDLRRGLTPPNYGKAAALYETKEQETAGESAIQNPKSKIQNPKSKIQNPLAEVGLPGATLLDQIKQFAAVEKSLKQQQQQRQTASSLPPLRELEGTVAGKLQIAFSPTTGSQARFEVAGNAWKWGNLTWDNLQLKGNWRQGALTLEALKIQTGSALLAFAGSISDREQSGQLQLTAIPLHQIANFTQLSPSLNLGGWLNGTVILGGSRANPLARGELTVENASINQTPLQQTQGQFLYKNARFSLWANSFLSREEPPLTLEGSIPYQLPFASIAPDSDRFDLTLKAKDGALAMLNLLSGDNLNWVNGRGEVNLKVFGTFDPQRGVPRQVEADGTATLQNATIALSAIPQDPLTAVNGSFHFDFDHIDVEQLTGSFSGGQIAAAGSLSLTQALPQKTPLTVNFSHLALNLPGIYQGGVKGQISVTGSAFQPLLGGEIALSQGVVLLEKALAKKVKSEPAGKTSTSSVEFAGLNLSLGDDIQVVLPPILNFAAAGNLTLNGKWDDLHPQGIIHFNSGYVNLFASLLRLSGAENQVEFFPERGLNPYLNLQLAASTAETSPSRLPVGPSEREIRDPFTANLDSLSTVRIQATVRGFASKLEDSIELTSTPARSQQEILALLGSNVVNTLNTLGSGETAVGLSNLASSAVLGPVQGAISNALGLTEFRIFTTPLLNERERIGGTQIGVGAEASANLTQDLSLSVLKILNTDRPPQVGLRYRLGDHWIIRGTSNFSDEGRAAIEYEQRF